MEREPCKCDEHGDRWTTFVCTHIAQAAIDNRTVGFVCYPSEDNDDLADAWCDVCEDYLQAHGGEWNDETCNPPDGLKILCSQCYRKARDLAAASRRLRIL